MKLKSLRDKVFVDYVDHVLFEVECEHRLITTKSKFSAYKRKMRQYPNIIEHALGYHFDCNFMKGFSVYT